MEKARRKDTMKAKRFWKIVFLFCAVPLGWGCDQVQPMEETHPEPEPEIEMAFVLIKAGTFEMGDIAGNGHSWERPVHTITLTRDFYIGKYEVTQVEYQALMGNNPSSYRGANNLPVENVSWTNAVRFANALSEREGLLPCYGDNGIVFRGDGNLYDCEGFRLPTEAEWEYAARAGTTSTWPHGEDRAYLREYAWFSGAAGPGRTQPVGSLLPNPWGLYDVLGNVYEWANDWYEWSYYERSPTVDPLGPIFGAARVKRGGSVRTIHAVRSANRSSCPPTIPGDDIGSGYGFRLARTAH